MNKYDWAYWRAQVWRWAKNIVSFPLPQPPVDYNELYRINDEIRAACSHPREAMSVMCMWCGGMFDLEDFDKEPVAPKPVVTGATNKTEYVTLTP